MASRAPLLDQLQGRMDAMTRAQRALAQYVLRHYQQVAFSTISEVARAANVSEATVVRFANTLGFSGYPPFQKEVRRIVRADLKGTDRFRLTAEAPAPADDPLSAAIRTETGNIAHLGETLDRAALVRAANAIRGAPEVLIVGERSTASLAQHLWFALDKLRLPVARALSVDLDTYHRLDRMNAAGCVVVIGFPRYLRSLVTLLAAAKARGLTTIAITDSPFSALKAEIGLFAPAESASFVAFHAAPLILLNALVDSIGRADRAATLGSLQHFEQLAERAGFFHAP
jgi:DNA-binding MurR/RpiR family transcriptional regulator